MKIICMFILTFSVMANNFKLAFVDIAQVIEESKKGQLVEKKLEEKAVKKEKELGIESKEQKIFKMKEDFEKRRHLLNEKTVAKERELIDIEIENINILNEEFLSFLKEEEIKLKDPLINEIKKAIEEVSKDEGITIVIPKEIDEVILFLAYPKEDLTSKIIKRLDSK